MLKRLREDQGKEIAITGVILIAVAKNAEIIQVLVDSRDELCITPQVLRAVAEGESRDKIIRLYCKRKDMT